MANDTRVSTIKDRNGITVTIKAKKNWFLLAFLPFWLTGWTIGGIAAISALITGKSEGPFLIIWLCGWIVGETLVILIWSWTAFGQEVISIRDGSFLHRREVLGRGLSREFRLHELYNLRASGFFGSDDGMSSSLAQYGLSGGTVALDTRFGDTYRFGIKLSEHEAGELAKDLTPYFHRDIQQALGADSPASSLYS
jgi:hypothetical protein